VSHAFSIEGSNADTERGHESVPVAFAEISLAEVPDAVGKQWKGNEVFLPQGYGEEWRDAFTRAFVLAPDAARPQEKVYVLINKSTNPDAGEYVSFATFEGDEFSNQALLAFNALNRPKDSELPRLYENLPVAMIMGTTAEHKKGIGSHVLELMNAFSKQQYGVLMHSDLERYHLTNGAGVMPGWRMWESLERKGIVKKYQTPLGDRFVFEEEKEVIF